VVVASSIDRMAWRRIRAVLADAGVPTVLYVREQSAFGHLTISQVPPDRLITNAAVHTEYAAELGVTADTIPSIVSVDDVLVPSSRERVLFVNPVPLSGLDIAVALARARPDLAFAFAESWLLAPSERAALTDRLSELPNVEFRAFDPEVRRLYRDARILLAPYLTNGRPRVVLEAQANGVPVLGSDLPAVREAVGPGGAVVAPDAPIADWVAALSGLVDDDARYERFVDAARRHAARDEVDPDRIAAQFEGVVAELVAAATNRTNGGTMDTSNVRS
jgi:glycosyltransferase involved in cell wall biosynthesis